MKTRNEYIHGMGTTLRHWSTQLGELQTQIQNSGAEQKDVASIELVALKAKQKAYQQHMKRVSEASDATMADTRLSAERMAEEFTAHLAQAARRLSV
jgi:hypothetical protein